MLERETAAPQPSSATAALPQRAAPKRLVESLGSILDRQPWIIKQWDADGDGTITLGEFRAQMVALRLAASAGEVEALFATLDDDVR